MSLEIDENEEELEQENPDIAMLREKHRLRGKILKIGTVFVLVFSLVVLVLLCFFMQHHNRKEMESVSELYMDGVSKQVSMDMGSFLNVHLSQAQVMVSSNPASNYEDTDSMKRDLIYNARVLGFDYLGFYGSDGKFEMLLGDYLELKNPEVLHNAITSNTSECAAAWGGRERNNVVLFGVPAQYPMEDGGESIGLVAGLSAEHFIDTMRLEKDDMLVRSYIIMNDGNYVIRSSGDYQDSYFSRVREEIDVSVKDADTYIEDLKNAMETGSSFFGVLKVGGENQYVSCSRIPNSEWFLLAVMSNGQLNSIVGKYNFHSILIQAVLILVIMVAFAVFLYIYLRVSSGHFEEMEEDRLKTIAVNQTKNVFLSDMSHDIRTPMNAMQGLTSIALMNLNKPLKVKNCLNKISLSGRHLLGLLNDILDTFKIESGIMSLNEECFSLRELMEDIVGITQPQMKEKGLNFEIFITNVPIEYVRIDSIRFSQIMLNLMSNAIKYTPKGGSVSIRLKEEEIPEKPDEIRVHVWVNDTGIGIAEDMQNKVFDYFKEEDHKQLNKKQGIGLGLAITKYIVELMGGKIELESEVYKGTEFHIFVDLKKEDNQKIEEMKYQGQRILLVDDNLEMSNSVIKTLNGMGLNAESVLSGGSAVRKVLEKNVKKEPFDAILLDGQLSGSTGFDMAKKLCDIAGEKVPVLMIVSEDWTDYEEEAKASGVSGFVMKPLFKSVLYEAVHPFFEQGRGTGKLEKKTGIDVTGMRVLLAEDNELNMEVAKALLNDVGILVEWAEDGETVVEMFGEHKAGYYDMILMDIRMPILDGYGAVRKIREMDRKDAKKIPVIAMTADAFPEDVKKCLDAGMDAHVSKPIEIDKLMKLMEKYKMKKS